MAEPTRLFRVSEGGPPYIQMPRTTIPQIMAMDMMESNEELERSLATMHMNAVMMRKTSALTNKVYQVMNTFRKNAIDSMECSEAFDVILQRNQWNHVIGTVAQEVWEHKVLVSELETFTHGKVTYGMLRLSWPKNDPVHNRLYGGEEWCRFVICQVDPGNKGRKQVARMLSQVEFMAMNPWVDGYTKECTTLEVLSDRWLSMMTVACQLKEDASQWWSFADQFIEGLKESGARRLLSGDSFRSIKRMAYKTDAKDNVEIERSADNIIRFKREG